MQAGQVCMHRILASLIKMVVCVVNSDYELHIVIVLCVLGMAMNNNNILTN